MALGRRRWLACATTLAFIATAAPLEAVAQNEAVGPNEGVAAQLDYVAAPGCPTAADFEAIVAGRLGYSPFRADASERVVIRIEAAGAALQGRLEWQSGAGTRVGERTFPSRSHDCGELVRAMGFALALQVQLMAATAAPRESPPPPPPPPIEKSPPVATAPAAPPVAKTQAADGGWGARRSLAAGAGAFAGVGLSPSATAFGRLFATVTWPRFALEVAADVSAPTTLHRADGTGFSEQVLFAGLAGCGLSNRWSACLLAKAGELRVTGEGVEFPRTPAGFLVQMGVRVGVSQRLGQDGYIAAHLDGLVSLTRGVVTLDTLPVWQTPRVAALAGVDVGLRIW